jgi:hypothetical protein
MAAGLGKELFTPYGKGRICKDNIFGSSRKTAFPDNLSPIATNFAQRWGNTYEEVTVHKTNLTKKLY